MFTSPPLRGLGWFSVLQILPKPWMLFQEGFKKKRIQVTLSSIRGTEFHSALALAMLTQCNAVNLLSDAIFKEQSPPPIINLSQTLNSLVNNVCEILIVLSIYQITQFCM